MRKQSDFFEIIYPHKIADRSVNVLFDECHALPKDLQTPFLTLFAVNDSDRASVDTEDGGQAAVHSEDRHVGYERGGPEVAVSGRGVRAG